MKNNNDPMKKIEQAVDHVKIPSAVEREEEEKAAIELAVKMSSGLVEEEGKIYERPDYLIKCLVEAGAIPKEPEVQLEKLKEMFSINHAVCEKIPCCFCKHKSKIVEQIEDRLYLLPRMI
jgi:hypothetical protein